MKKKKREAAKQPLQEYAETQSKQVESKGETWKRSGKKKEVAKQQNSRYGTMQIEHMMNEPSHAEQKSDSIKLTVIKRGKTFDEFFNKGMHFF